MDAGLPSAPDGEENCTKDIFLEACHAVSFTPNPGYFACGKHQTYSAIATMFFFSGVSMIASRPQICVS
jgi:hypothetical protein